MHCFPHIFGQPGPLFPTPTCLAPTSPICSQGINQKRLQRDAQVRLNDFCDRLRNLPSVDLSAQNLGEEGTAYVIEALAFNPGCTAVDLSKNGIASVGKGGWVGGAGGGTGVRRALCT